MEQVGVAKEHGALHRRLGKRGEVVGRSSGNRLYVRFDGEDARVSIRPHLLRVLTTAGVGGAGGDADDARLSVEHIIFQLRELLPVIGDGHDR